MFNTEFDMLEGRLEYLNQSVDYFVMVEGNTSFTRVPKTLNWLGSQPRYQKYLHKILYFPCAVNVNNPMFANPWAVEEYQRNHISYGLQFFPDDAVVLISDVDEIPNKQTLNTTINQLSASVPAVAPLQDYYWYNFNQKQQDPWYGTVVTTKGHLKKSSPETLRKNRWSLPTVADGGWHLSWWCDIQAVQKKIREFSHQEFNNDQYNTPEIISQRMMRGEDMFGRPNPMIQTNLDQLPQDFREIFEKYSKSRV